MRLLSDRMVELGVVESLATETVRLQVKNALKPWRKKEWWIPRVRAGFVARMEDVLADTREPMPVKPVVPNRQDMGTGGKGTATCSWPVSPKWVGDSQTYGHH